MEIAILLIIILLLTGYILSPLLRPKEEFIVDESAQDRRLKELGMEKRTNLIAIKDIDFELATGKISPEDHQELRTLFSLKAAEAIEAEKRLRDDK